MEITFQCHVCQKQVTKQWASSQPVTAKFCSLACKSEHQRKAKPVTREWLVQKYTHEGMDCTAISKIVGRDPKTVWNWLQDFGIQTRPRGGSTAPAAFKKGQPSLFKGKKHTEEARMKMREISIADGRTPHPRDGIPYMRGRFGAMSHNWKGGITPERARVYASKAWIFAAAEVWRRSESKCERCGVAHNPNDNRRRFHVHHIVRFEVKALQTDTSNLALLCAKCHHFVHSKKNVDSEFIKTEGKNA